MLATRPALEREAQSAAGPADPDVVAVVDRVFSSSEHPGLKWSAIPDTVPTLKPLYDAEGDRLMWFERNAPVPGVERALAAIGAAGDHGLDPADYDAASLAEQWTSIKAGSASAPERALFDLGMSVATARLIRSVHMGRVDPRTMQWGYTVVPKKIDVTAVVREVREGKGLGATLDEMQPQVPHYARARKTLALYKLMARSGEPVAVPALAKGQTKVEPGKSWDGVPQLIARLRALGDLTGAAAAAIDTGTLYAPPIVQAVKRFQERHGLETDGVIGAGTLRALNVPLAQRVRQIELAMERMRWLPELDDRPNLFVNVPLFRMWATDPRGVEEPLRMNVVVGQSLESPDAALRRAAGIRDLPPLLEPALRDHGDAGMHDTMLQAPFLWYGKQFLKLTHGVSRQQEFVADGVAAAVAGAGAQASALRRVTAAAVAFDAYMRTELLPVVRAGYLPPVAEGFDQFNRVPGVSAKLAEVVQHAEGSANADPFDTHPSLRERLAALGETPVDDRREPVAAMSLITNVEGTARSLLEHTWGDKNVRGLRPLRWEDVGESVYATEWRAVAARHAAWLAQFTAERIPASDRELMHAGVRPRRQGRIERRCGRTPGRAMYVIAAGLACLLLDRGWKADRSRAGLELANGPERISPSDDRAAAARRATEPGGVERALSEPRDRRHPVRPGDTSLRSPEGIGPCPRLDHRPTDSRPARNGARPSTAQRRPSATMTFMAHVRFLVNGVARESTPMAACRSCGSCATACS